MAVLDGHQIDGLSQFLVADGTVSLPYSACLVSIRAKICRYLAITNHHSRRGDFDIPVRDAIRIGDDLSQSPNALDNRCSRR